MMHPETIQSQLLEQRARLNRACQESGRDPGAVHLLAVSKHQPAAAVRAAYEAGQRDFGENYVQEMVLKAEELKDLSDIRFHLIGHLQTNKVRFVAPLAYSVQTVDSEKLVLELAKRVAQRGRTARVSPHAHEAPGTTKGMDAPKGSVKLAPLSVLPLSLFIEVNVSGEASKSGCAPEDVLAIADAIERQPTLKLAGLMAIPPATDDPEAARPYFERLLKIRLEAGGARRFPELSMGMSHDAEVAISCGATWVRIGTAIFGPRSASA